MSRSKRQPIIKDGPRNHKKSSLYWRTVRRVTKDKVRYFNETIEDEIIPDPKEIIDDYDYSDYETDLRFNKDKEYAKRMSRK
jgi:hypothetical protein